VSAQINQVRHLSVVADSNIHDLDEARRHRADLLRDKRADTGSTPKSGAGRRGARTPLTYRHALGRDGPDAA
jgi:hypothetical protein